MRACGAPSGLPTVLHVLDPESSGDAAVAAAALLARTAGFNHRFWILGGTNAESRVNALGIESTDRLAVVGGSPRLTARAAARLAADRALPSLVCSWSVRTMELAHRVFGFRMPRAAVLTEGPGDPLSGSARGADGARLLALGPSVWEAWMRIPDVDARLCNLPWWSASYTRDVSHRRASVREALGLDASDTAVLLLGDPAPRGDAVRFAFLTGVQFVAGQQAAGIVRLGSHGVRRAARFVRAHARRWGLAVSDLPLTHLLAAADMAVCLDAAPGSVPGATAGASATTLRLAASMGVPVVAAPSSTASQVIGSLIPEALASENTDRALAARMVELSANTPLRRELAARLRAAADAGGGAFEQSVSAVFSEMLARVVVRPGLPVPRVLEEAAA